MRHSILNHSYYTLPTFYKMKPIYSNPDCDYQRFLNALQLEHFCVSNKDVVTNANKMGKEAKNDKKKIISYSREAFHTDEHSYVLGIDIQ